MVTHRQQKVAPATFAAQGKRREGGVPGLSSQFQCSRCAISYAVIEGDKAKCPMCEVERENKRLHLLLQESTEKVRNLTSTMQTMSAQVDHVTALRDALAIIGTDDLTWIKGVLYRYRQDKSISLLAAVSTASPTSTRRGRNAPRDCFTLVERGRDNEEMIMSSAGGRAIVGYYDEITKELGTQMAMSYLLRALSQTLIGGQF